MGCSFSGLNALYEVVNGGGGDVWINQRRFRIVNILGEGGFAFVYQVREMPSAAAADGHKHRLTSEDGSYALKKVIIQTEEQLELVKKEIHVSSLFSHPNLLPLIDHSIIAVKGPQEGAWNHEAYLLFPVHMDGTILDVLNRMQARKEFFSAMTVLQIFRQICEGLSYMHKFDPPYAHNDLKPGNVLLSKRENVAPLAVVMDFGSAAPARRKISSRSEALALQEWASQHCSAPYRAPELWDCPSSTEVDEKTDIWSLGCTLFAIMYGVSPFEYTLGESGGSLQLAAMSGQIKWPPGPKTPFPESLHQFVTWMLRPSPELRPNIEDIIIHVDKLLSKLPSSGIPVSKGMLTKP